MRCSEIEPHGAYWAGWSLKFAKRFDCLVCEVIQWFDSLSFTTSGLSRTFFIKQENNFFDL